MKLYLAGPMRGYPQFNFPAFHEAAAQLREEGHEVFSPAERDIKRHNGVDISVDNSTGCEKTASRLHGFDLREAFADDTAWICRHADGLALLSGWETSKGACAEYALAAALGLPVFLWEPV